MIPFKFGYTMRVSITARTANTTFFIGKSKFDTFAGNLHRWFQLSYDYCFLIEADQPIAVAVFTADADDPSPVMMHIPAVEQFQSTYFIPVPFDPSNDLAFRVTLFVIADRHTDVFLLNGRRWSVPTQFRRKLQTFFDRDFYGFKVPVASRMVSLSSENFHRFGVMVYAPSAIGQCSYAFSLHSLMTLDSEAGFLPVDIPLGTTTTVTTPAETSESVYVNDTQMLDVTINDGGDAAVTDAYEDYYSDEPVYDYHTDYDSAFTNGEALVREENDDVSEGILIPDTELSTARSSSTSMMIVVVAVVAFMALVAAALQSKSKKSRKESRAQQSAPSQSATRKPSSDPLRRPSLSPSQKQKQETKDSAANGEKVEDSKTNEDQANETRDTRDENAQAAYQAGAYDEGYYAGAAVPTAHHERRHKSNPWRGRPPPPADTWHGQNAYYKAFEQPRPYPENTRTNKPDRVRFNEDHNRNAPASGYYGASPYAAAYYGRQWRHPPPQHGQRYDANPPNH